MSWIRRFGGLYRDVEIEATPALSIDDAYVVGDLDKQLATVHVTLRSVGAAREVAGGGWPRPCLRSTELSRVKPWGRLHSTAKIQKSLREVPLDPFRAWSPEQPNLYRADIVLKLDGELTDGWVERFGVRKWEVRGANFYLNNQKYFIRGYGDDAIYPLTLSSPASRETHRRHLELAKQYGFAYVRHHTHCEVPEFFEAADELGVMVQPELPYCGTQPSADAAEFFRPMQDLTELHRHYRRYVSFSTYCMGNEGDLGSPLDHKIYQFAKSLDPTRLVQQQDGSRN